MSAFEENIKHFNSIYKLPVEVKPTLYAVGDPVARLKAFKDILAEELNEVDEVIRLAEAAEGEGGNDLQLTTLTALADLLGDIQVYCASEMAKFGLPLDAVLNIIMQSNFSKLDSDGQPIYDSRGKVMKGPFYWKPEPKIRELLQTLSQ
jgi:predicted HAD superfamily Cof-like phosphohydrolase